MCDPGELLCAPEDRARLEVANGVEQIDYLSDLLSPERRIQEVRESHILEFNRIAVKGIYTFGGTYRDAGTEIIITDSAHKPPAAALVPTHIVDLIERLNSTRGTSPATHRAAYALWRLNWIHPFKDGNGRTARALSYLVLCVDAGQTLPGLPQMPTLIYNRRADYVAALKRADETAIDGSDPDLDPMVALVQDVITLQLAAAIEALSGENRQQP